MSRRRPLETRPVMFGDRNHFQRLDNINRAISIETAHTM